MIIYLDILIFLNFIINYTFVKLIYLLFNEKINILRIIISSIISVLLLFSFLFDYQIYNLIKIFGGILLVFISFKFSNKKRFIIMVCLFYILHFSFIGVLNIFNVKGCSIFVFLMLICLFIMITTKKCHIYNKKTYKVIIKLNNNLILNLDGFLDTGNMASYLGKPIIFIDIKYYTNTLKINNSIKIKTVNDCRIINCYKPKDFYIIDNNQKIHKDVLIAFTKFDKDINCLLNNLIFT